MIKLGDTSNIITYFKLRENQNDIVIIRMPVKIITYFKLRENQNCLP